MDNLRWLAVPAAVYAYTALRRRKLAQGKLPPLVQISPEDIFTRPQEAYAEALQAHGPIIAVRRKGNLEYIVNHEYARHVLTCDRLFSFEEGSAAVMNLQPIMALTKGAIFRDLQDIVRDGIIARIDETVERIYPLYARDATRLLDDCASRSKTGKGGNIDSFTSSRRTIAETTLILLFGQDYVTERNLRVVTDVSNGMAELTGQYQNFSFIGKYLPSFWIFLTWVNVIIIQIPCAFLFVLGPQLWDDVDRYHKLISGGILPRDEPRHVFFLMVKNFSPSDGRSMSLWRRLYLAILLLCLIFASIHTTTVVSQWVLFQLAAHPECLQPLRDELARIGEEDDSGNMRLTAASLREARLLDSFVREVMRLKGDTIAAMRITTCDVPLGDYIIPKGSFVTPMACTVHENPEVFGDNPREFNGFQWAEQGKDAAMTGAAHLVFGLGRFACPGRVLAVNEIKLIVLSLIGRATPTLLEGRFEVSDPLNTVTQPPKGTLLWTPLEKPIL